jgi:uncharacterized protein (DUF305 family)
VNSKSLLIGIVSFIAGALLVSVAAVTIEKPQTPTGQTGMAMENMAADLQGKTGDEFDKAFLSGMIRHHQDAVDMARMAGERAKHQEIKDLSQEIITAQAREIQLMQEWQRQWGYEVGGHNTPARH